MGLLDIFRRKSVYSLRKRYDRLREKADREKNMTKRIEVLQLLDQTEPSLVVLEEQIVSSFERRRMGMLIHRNLQKVDSILKDKEYSRPLTGDYRRR
ncbi:hypothetical protein HY501_00345 [Candidatus Woesearchaeota archaeon]|nr:hypothetical protein [Candidatus Woesearchaeota archaeon]